MCLAVPARILEVHDNGMGLADHAGAQKLVSLMLLEDCQVGEYVIIHAGFAIHKVDEEAAMETMRYLEMLAQEVPPDYDPNREMG